MPRSNFTRTRLMCGVAAVAMAIPLVAHAEAADFNIAPQALTSALKEFGIQSQYTVVAEPDVVATKLSRGVSQSAEPEVALTALLQGTGLSYRREGDAFLIVRADDPQSGSAAGDGADGTVEALIVTAQKREEDIQDVPIAISAFSQEDLTRSQVAGGPDLITQVPNFTFTKTNFSSYSIQIRGIGTQAISATTDPAVAVAFNNTPFIRNRFFEQEFYDLQRVEVLRGPQGTLYGRNATAGVVNIISQKPKFTYEARAAADIANYASSRLEGMVNIPLVEDRAALRVAGAWTKRDGYATNQITGNPIDGRDLWSTRVSLRLAPTDALDVNLIWEHFEEEDDRLRSGKQLCNTHEITEVAGIPVGKYDSLANMGQGGMYPAVAFSQGCERDSLYSPDSFQTPDGLSLPYYYPLSFIFLPAALVDPYVSRFQSQDLRVIESTVDPQYKARTDVFEAQISFDLNDRLTLSSETAYARDTIFSTQDYNRFNTASGAWLNESDREGVITPGPNGGIFCDPQIGCADRMVAVDLSTAESRHFSQEFRLASDFEGAFNFSLGTNFLRYDTEDKYYVFINSLGLISAISPYGHQGELSPYQVGVSDNLECMPGYAPPDPNKIYPVVNCTYMDPNPIGSLNDLGHNYFLSKNPYKLISYALFGEAYYNISDTLKLTAGLRFTVDKKEAPRIPSWVPGSNAVGHPVAEVVRQEWREPTGRVTLDWKPDLAFTDETLLYASYAHGYKAGGSNPPPAAAVMYCPECGTNANVSKAAVADSATHPRRFDAEFVDAFEVGAKNTLLDGRVTANLAAFFYDYKNYQISEIVNRAAINRNFDATVWGFEVEADWRPLENLRFGVKTGYERTRIGDGEKAVDLMDRTAGDPNWTLVRPFPTFAANCIFPTEMFRGIAPWDGSEIPLALGGVTGGNPGGCELAYLLNWDPVTSAPYKPDPVPGVDEGPFSELAYHPGWKGFNPLTAPNHGEGIDKDLSGNELPNAPKFTATLTVDYTLPLPHEWLATLHTDLHWQGQSWWRVFNDHEYNRLDEYFTMNLAAIFTNEDAGWKIMAYVKNVTDETAITGAFLNSDDTGLTTNVFLTEPRLYGLRVTKEWIGGSPFGAFGERRQGPFPLTVEFGGQVQRQAADYETFRPGFAGAFPEELDVFADPQGRDLDWGDGRELKLTLRPNAGPWTVSGAIRYGRTNTDTARVRGQLYTDKTCVAGGKYAVLCDPSSPYYNPYTLMDALNWSDASARNQERHELADFAVGRDIGIGGLARSTLSAGLRYAHFESSSQMEFGGVPDFDVDNLVIFPADLKYGVEHTRFGADVEAEREFSGGGPTLSWDASFALLGDDDVGRLRLDWALTGGVLFGKQTTSVEGRQVTSLYDDVAPQKYSSPQQTSVIPISVRRSENVTVPTFGASVGLSYTVDRLSLGAGYRWETYGDVLDGGFQQKSESDRTLDGPYFKLAVGFGG